MNYCSWPASAIHGDKSQQERDFVLNGKTFCYVTLNEIDVPLKSGL